MTYSVNKKVVLKLMRCSGNTDLSSTEVVDVCLSEEVESLVAFESNCLA